MIRPKMRSEEVGACDPAGFMNIADTTLMCRTYPLTILVLPVSPFGRLAFTSL